MVIVHDWKHEVNGNGPLSRQFFFAFLFHNFENFHYYVTGSPLPCLGYQGRLGRMYPLPLIVRYITLPLFLQPPPQVIVKEKLESWGAVEGCPRSAEEELRFESRVEKRERLSVSRRLVIQVLFSPQLSCLFVTKLPLRQQVVAAARFRQYFVADSSFAPRLP